ncbi:hypothetical protein R3X26_07770 [Vibrio sp. TH_r3]|uniref:hypothetical protein n=1 Tax=Vibrio sp. TH_r3 TaxID=3082084 RepID=UPI0029544136|nr:hypothetical protein [Vibrio sp. TH_r3]MDV7104303.1 hypothetical protein [Vibrio sp. TH_r3]
MFDSNAFESHIFKNNQFEKSQVGTNTDSNNFADINQATEAKNSVNSIYSALASLSNRKQWILYTANCPRPIHAELIKHDINCNTIIHMKPSSLFCEEEIVIKAIKAGTASAIVASSGIEYHSRSRINTLASIKGCAVFYLGQNPEQSKLCH